MLIVPGQPIDPGPAETFGDEPLAIRSFSPDGQIEPVFAPRLLLSFGNPLLDHFSRALSPRVGDSLGKFERLS